MAPVLHTAAITRCEVMLSFGFKLKSKTKLTASTKGKVGYIMHALTSHEYHGAIETHNCRR